MKPETLKMILVGGAVIVALGVVLFLYLRPSNESGTIQAVPKQMKPSARTRTAQ